MSGFGGAGFSGVASQTNPPGRVAVADTNYTMTGAESVISFTSCTTVRVVVVNPALLTIGKIYEVRDDSGTLWLGGQLNGQIQIARQASGPNINDRMFNGRPGFYINKNYGSLRFRTLDGVHVISDSADLMYYQADARNAPLLWIGPGAGDENLFDGGSGSVVDLYNKWVDNSVAIQLVCFQGLQFGMYNGNPSGFNAASNCRNGAVFDFGAGVLHNITTICPGTTGLNVVGFGDGTIGFFSNVGSPSAQIASANQTALTDSTGGSTSNATLNDVGASPSQSIINANFAKISKLLNEIRSDLVTFGFIKGSA